MVAGVICSAQDPMASGTGSFCFTTLMGWFLSLCLWPSGAKRAIRAPDIASTRQGKNEASLSLSSKEHIFFQNCPQKIPVYFTDNLAIAALKRDWEIGEQN